MPWQIVCCRRAQEINTHHFSASLNPDLLKLRNPKLRTPENQNARKPEPQKNRKPTKAFYLTGKSLVIWTGFDMMNFKPKNNKVSEALSQSGESNMSSEVYGQTLTSEYLLERFELSEAELEVVRGYGKSLDKKWNQYVEEFYAWLSEQPEYGDFFEDADLLKDVQGRQVEYWKDFFKAEVDSNYVERRKKLGNMHAHIQLPLDSYLTAVNKSLSILTDSMRDKKMSGEDAAAMKTAVTKLLNMDNTIIVSTFMAMTQQKISEQTEAIMQMSTPVAAIWDGILLLPIVGIIDSGRANEIMNSVLNKILETHAKVIILDISGVAVVDTAVANHLIKITKASALMGCHCTITGMSPAVAQTIVELGIDAQSITTTANLHDSLKMAFEEVGVSIS